MRARHADIIDWCRIHRVALKQLRIEKGKTEKGFLGYLKDAQDFWNEYSDNKKKRSEGKPISDEKTQKAENKVLYQQAASQDLLRRMKWKRATWDDDADFNGFSRRILSNDDLFKRIPAFSFLCIKVIKDPSNFSTARTTAPDAQFTEGDLTNWHCRERDPVKKQLFKPPTSNKTPFTVDWVSAEVRFLDSATPQEVLTFLRTMAPQVQAAQVRIEDSQTEITTDIENARVRLGVLRFKFNECENSFWDDPQRLKNPHYVSPAHMRQFLDGVLAGAFFYRFYLFNQEIRIVHPNLPYKINLERNEVQIPANFADFNWIPIHQKAIAFEKFLNFSRFIWWFWFALAVMIVGDLEII